jgi:hypothetical protein
LFDKHTNKVASIPLNLIKMSLLKYWCEKVCKNELKLKKSILNNYNFNIKLFFEMYIKNNNSMLLKKPSTRLWWKFNNKNHNEVNFFALFLVFML